MRKITLVAVGSISWHPSGSPWMCLQGVNKDVVLGNKGSRGQCAAVYEFHECHLRSTEAGEWTPFFFKDVCFITKELISFFFFF